MAKKLIVNADDFGIHEAVNRAVCRGFESGILTSTSLMAGGRAFDEAVKLAGDMKGVGIGIHLTLVGDWKPFFHRKRCRPLPGKAAACAAIIWSSSSGI